MDLQEQQNTPSEEAYKKKRGLPIFVIFFIILAAAVCGSIFIFSKKNIKNDKAEEKPALGYDDSATVVTDEDELQKLVDGMIEQTKDGKIALEYKNTATSTDGKHFSCYLTNSIRNPYDMYIGIYMDSELTDEVLLTKLIAPGSGLETFETSRVLEPGDYETVLVFTRVQDDHKTIKDQISVIYTLTVQ